MTHTLTVHYVTMNQKALCIAKSHFELSINEHIKLYGENYVELEKVNPITYV